MARTLSLCMIVKDEERYLEDCLASVQGVVDEIVIVDTGSTDATVAIAERHGAKVIHSPWTGDFAAARNVSLEHATSDWILVLDADERLMAESLPELRGLLEAEDVAGYSLVCENRVGTTEAALSQHAPVFRLFRNRLGIRFEGMIHEQAIPSAKRTGRSTLASGVRILHLGYLAEEVARRDKRERNRKILERQAAQEPDNPFVHFNLAEVLKLQERQAEAERHYLHALDLLTRQGGGQGASYHANLYFSLGDLYRCMGRFVAAHAVLDEAIARYPDFPDLYYTKGFTCFDAGHYTEAIPLFERCHSLRGVQLAFPTDPDVSGHKAMRAIADCHIRLGDRTQARIYLEKTLALHPAPDAELHANLGVLLAEADEDEAAIDHLEAAVAQAPDHLRAWLNLAFLYLRDRRYTAADAAWERRPADVECQALLALGCVLGDRPLPVGRPDDAALIRSWCGAVEMALLSDRTAMVQDLLDRLDGLGEALPGLELALAMTFLRCGLADPAVGALLRAQQRDPADPAIYRALGDACLAMNEPEEAKTMYAKAEALAR